MQTFGRTNSQSSEKRSSSTSKPNSNSTFPLDCHSYTHPSHDAVGVGRLLFPIFALALDLPEDFFDDKVRCYLTSHHPQPQTSMDLPTR